MPPTAEALIRASLIRLEMPSCSSTPRPVWDASGPSSIACLKTSGSSSGRFRADKVVAAMKYQEFRGRFGCFRMVASSAGVMMGVKVAMIFRICRAVHLDPLPRKSYHLMTPMERKKMFSRDQTCPELQSCIKSNQHCQFPKRRWPLSIATAVMASASG